MPPLPRRSPPDTTPPRRRRPPTKPAGAAREKLERQVERLDSEVFAERERRAQLERDLAARAAEVERVEAASGEAAARARTELERLQRRSDEASSRADDLERDALRAA